jgi:hypothetical protein
VETQKSLLFRVCEDDSNVIELGTDFRDRFGDRGNIEDKEESEIGTIESGIHSSQICGVRLKWSNNSPGLLS